MTKDKLIALLLLTIGLIFIFNLTGSIWRLWQQDEPIKEAETKLEKLKEENTELKRKKSYINSERFFEEQARDNLNLAKEDEAIVVVPEEVLNLKDEKGEGGEEQAVPNWRKWLEIFW